MGLVHTCTKYGYMQEQTKDMHDLEELLPLDTNYESPVSRLANLGLGKLCDESNMHHHTYHCENIT